MVSNQFGAVLAGLRKSYKFAANKYLLSGLVENFRQGRRSYIENKAETQRSIECILKDFEEVAVKELQIVGSGFSRDNEDIAAELAEQVEPLKHEVYPFTASLLFNDYSTSEEDLPVTTEESSQTGTAHKREKALLCMVMAREQVRLSEQIGSWHGESRADLRQCVRREMGEFDFTSPDSEELRFLSTFETLAYAIREGNRVEDSPLYTGEPEEPEKAYRDFIHTFLPFLDYPSYDSEGESEQERLRSKVIQIVRQGELNTAAAGRNLLEIIQKEEKRILRKYTAEKAFIIFSQNWYGSRDTDQFKNRIQRKFPYHVETGGGRYAYSKPKFEGQEQFYLTKHIVFTEKDYSGAEDFYNRALEGLIPEGHFVAVLQTENGSPYYPQSESELFSQANSPENIQNAIQGIEFFETSTPPEDITSHALDNLVGDEIEVKEMLRSLRIDVLIPGLSSDEERTLRENRERIEREFEVSDIFDWRKKDSADIGSFLYYLDEQTGNTEEEWQSVASELVNTSTEWFTATETVSNSL